LCLGFLLQHISKDLMPGYTSYSNQMESFSVSETSDLLTDELATSVCEKKKFHIDASKIQSVPVDEQNDELQNLGLQVYNQETFEQGQYY